ncbi:MAG: histidine phosphatase family protein [Candidatus Latescibacteria bacterium]|nr:histidine phosphatase family protein [Candidatus Latescibacterota bacterium]
MGRNLFTGVLRTVKTLLIMRHAKSDWSTAGADFDRPLNKRGRQAVPQVAHLLSGLEEKPRLILSSPAARARETAEGLAAALDCDLIFDPRLYLAPPQTLGAVLGEQDDRCDPLLVMGHNPGLEEWLALLGGGVCHLPTAGLAALALEAERWSEVRAGQGRLQWFFIPRLAETLGR